MPDNSISFFAPGEDDAEEADLKVLPHLPGLPTIWYSSLIGRGETTVHLSFTDCDHNSEPLPGLANFLRSATTKRQDPPQESDDLYLQTSLEFCAVLAPYLVPIIAAHPNIMPAISHLVGHLGIVLNRVICLLFLFVVSKTGESEWAREAFTRSFIEGQAEGDSPGLDKLKEVCQAILDYSRCKTTLPEELWTLGADLDKPATS